MKETIVGFGDLLAKCSGNYIAYQNLLSTIEWHERRNPILKRDKGICQQCGKGRTIEVDYTSYHPHKGSHFWENKITLFDGYKEKNYKLPLIFGVDPSFFTVPISDNGVITAFQGLSYSSKPIT